MKAKELIEILKKMNPENEVVIGGEAIHFVEELPGYYDGPYQILEEDLSLKPYYAVKGINITNKGQKIKIHTISIEDIIWNCETVEELEKLRVNIDPELSHYKDKIEEIKNEFKKNKLT